MGRIPGDNGLARFIKAVTQDQVIESYQVEGCHGTLANLAEIRHAGWRRTADANLSSVSERGRGMRSLPEKTLEHWASLYLSSRLPRAEQWWPTLGEDIIIALRSSLISPGKIILLEVKVPEATSDSHKLSISTAQLRRYLSRRLPVFYVLPVPCWPGPLDPGTTSPRPAAGWWRQRSENWFGGWTYLLSAADVAANISMTAENPVLYSLSYDDLSAGTRPPALAQAIPWQYFWSEVLGCGPAGKVRWRLSRDRRGRIIATDLASQEQIVFDDAESTRLADFGSPQLPVQQDDNLAIIHIDEDQIQLGS